ncbi:hypothetical protein [Lishizhenia sp.]|uniref:hypothetical protein n=1 Tax=Lishizhenia sp. TaxID=2497594 RepID=UPI00299E0E21|nr:hypothetical protein [Lishizhenia sp.]MDX1446184.1 hypothetical protein [Lishizhenia sp.]
MYKWEGQVLNESDTTALTDVSLNFASVDTLGLSGDLSSSVEWSNYLYLVLFVVIIYIFYAFMKRKG